MRNLVVASFISLSLSQSINCGTRFTPVDLTSHFNAPCEAKADPLYRPPTGVVTLGGIPFLLPDGTSAPFCSWQGVHAAASALSLPVAGCPNATGVRVLISTLGGSALQGIATLSAAGGPGGGGSLDLQGNVAVRDKWLYYTSSLKSPPAVNVWRGAHTVVGPESGASVLDMQTLDFAAPGLTALTVVRCAFVRLPPRCFARTYSRPAHSRLNARRQTRGWTTLAA